MALEPDQKGLGARLAAFGRALAPELFSHYRPERHYMRGPGPKWREKHGLKPAPAQTVSPPAFNPLYPGSVPA